MSERTSFTDAELQACVDGRLDPGDDERVRAVLEADPVAAARASAYRDINQRLRAAYDPVAAEPVPERLLQAARPRGWWRQAAAAVALLVLGGAAGWTARDLVPPEDGAGPGMARWAISAHSVYERERRHAVEVGADEEQHLVRWLSKRLGYAVTTPDLTPLGYHLVGGRLLPLEGRAAAQFMFERDGTRLTIYVTPNPGLRVATEFRYEVEDGFGVFYWLDEDLGYAITGRIDRAELLELANLVYEELRS